MNRLRGTCRAGYVAVFLAMGMQAQPQPTPNTVKLRHTTEH